MSTEQFVDDQQMMVSVGKISKDSAFPTFFKNVKNTFRRFKTLKQPISYKN